MLEAFLSFVTSQDLLLSPYRYQLWHRPRGSLESSGVGSTLGMVPQCAAHELAETADGSGLRAPSSGPARLMHRCSYFIG